MGAAPPHALRSRANVRGQDMKTRKTASWINLISLGAISLVLVVRSYALRELVVLGFLLALLFVVAGLAIAAGLVLSEAARTARQWMDSRLSVPPLTLEPWIARARVERLAHNKHSLP